MSTPKDVQFKGIENIMTAYDNMEIPAFSIWCGKEMNFKYEGDSMDEGTKTLFDYLELLRMQGSWAIYSLKVYEDFSGKITNKTPYDGSFNFQLNTSPNYIDGQAGGQLGMILSKMSALEKRLDDQDAEDEEQDDYGMGVVGRVLMHPAIQQLIPHVMGFLTSLKPKQMNASVNGVTVDPGQNQPPLMVRYNDAIDVLQSVDPNFIETLEKLARLAKTQPDTYKGYVTMFGSMNV